MEVTYFRDDHGRIIRVVAHDFTGRAELYVSEVLSNGEKAWVSLPLVNLVDAISESGSSIEAFDYKRLVETARKCPLFRKEAFKWLK